MKSSSRWWLRPLPGLLSLGLACSCAPEAPPGDAGDADAGPRDAGGEDAGVPEDAGLEDAGLEDAGLDDAGLDDAGVEDAGVEDAGAPDAGGVDAGGGEDGGAPDAGAPDAGAADAGVSEGLLAKCMSPVTLQDGVVVEGDTTAAGNDTLGSCTGGAAPEVVYRYVVQAPTAHVTIQVNPTDGDDFGVYVRTDCEDPGAEARPCAENRPAAVAETLRPHIQEAGTELFVFVDGFREQDEGPFEIVLEETPVTVLAVGADCDPDASDAVCDDRRGHQCLSDGDGTFSCYAPAPNVGCQAAAPVDEDGTLTGQLGAGRNVYDALDIGDCTGTNTGGTDVAYQFDIAAGETFSAEVAAEGDAALYVVSDCPPLATSCVAGANEALAGEPESLRFTNMGAARTLYLVVDSFDPTPPPQDWSTPHAGFFTLDWDIDTPTLLVSEVGHDADSGASWVELYNATTGPVGLAGLELRVYANGAGSPSSSFALPDVDLAAGATLLVVSDATAFAAAFPGVDPDVATAGIAVDGDDALELFDTGTSARIDVYGEPGVDGTGSTWEYADAAALRRPARIAGEASFQAADWEVVPTAAATPGARD